MRKIVRTRSLLSNIIKDASTIMCNPLSEYVGTVTHDCDSIVKKRLVFLFTIMHMCMHKLMHCALKSHVELSASKDGIVFSSHTQGSYICVDLLLLLRNLC